MPLKYANIAFNLPLNSLFTYSIPDSLKDEIEIGSRVLAPFGKRNITGVVLEFPESANLKRIKSIIKPLDAEPSLNTEMINFCNWISKYYICPIGEVIFSALPRGTAVESKLIYSIDKLDESKSDKITKIQRDIISILKIKPLAIKQIEKKLKTRNIYSNIKKLLKYSILKQEYFTSSAKTKPKYEKYIFFELLDELRGFSNSILDNFLKETNVKSNLQIEALKYLIKNNIKHISLKELIKNSNTSSSAVNSLVKKELIKFENREAARRIEYEFSEEEKIKELNSSQKSVLETIKSSIFQNRYNSFLLFGVTGSGKTQVYIEAIKEVIRMEKTAIVLVPEISLTPQLIHRFRNHFGGIIGVIHSKLSEGQRFDVFRGIRANKIKIVIGARSALFAPLEKLGIIVVDEEHDHSYKQSEKNPKYNARDSALVRAKLNNAVVILGSATPSLESFFNAKLGKYELLELPDRALKTRQPEVDVVNMFDELKSSSKFVKYETPERRFLSSKLISNIDNALKNNQSVILLQNRRGYSAYLECQNCGFVKMCARCDITMIYHKIKNHLRCHYCGTAEKLPLICEKCSSEDITLKGTGTEKVEEEISRLFPKAKVRRMDADTMKRKDAHRKILKSFHDREFDILVGTQMISKGLDFPNVYLVGVVSADVGLYNPDFRSSEKTFQLLTQVSGRSGRISDYGKVIIQTMHTDNFIFQFIKNHDFVSFYEKELSFRKNFDYPPFSRMTLIEVKGNSINEVSSLASKIYLHLKRINLPHNDNSIEILKPSPALIYRIKNKFRYHIIVKTLKLKGDYLETTKLLNKLQS
ncbi:MAG: primosomal protein N', partial [Ignavibacteria bacterium]